MNATKSYCCDHIKSQFLSVKVEPSFHYTINWRMNNAPDTMLYSPTQSLLEEYIKTSFLFKENIEGNVGVKAETSSIEQ